MDEQHDCFYCRESAKHYFSRSGEEYTRCSGCGLIARRGNWVRQENVSAAEYYENLYFDKLAGDQMSGHRDRLFRQILDEIGGIIPTGSMLDVGCGCGHFLIAARERGWTVAGVEPSRKSRSHLREVQGRIRVVDSLDRIEPHERFDVITMINVLDLMDKPWVEIERTFGHLNPAGLLFLRVPNGLFHASVFRFLQRLNRERVAKQLTIFHQHSFVPVFIRRMLSRAGFEDIHLRNAHLSESVRISSRWPVVVNEAVRRMTWLAARSVECASFGRWIAGPSLEVWARKRQ